MIRVRKELSRPMSNIEEIRARCEKAAPGPWRVWEDGRTVWQVNEPRCTIARGADRPDAKFIAHARQDIPALLDHIEALEVKLAEAERESEAAIKRLSELGDCETCIHDGEFLGYSDKPGYRCATPICGHGGEKGNWQWRGVPERK